MNVPPLCILQMRYNSSRLPAKMLQTIGGETLAARGWRIACEAFYEGNCVVAIPAHDSKSPLMDELKSIGARVALSAVRENDVLLRFYDVAHRYRWHPDSVIVRYTADDWRKQPAALRAVANGVRLPVEIGGEAFTLAQLDAKANGPYSEYEGEHLTRLFFPLGVEPAPDDGAPWSIDTPEDLEAARAKLATTEPCVRRWQRQT